MAYGVIASKSCQVAVRTTDTSAATDRAADRGADRVLDLFQGIWGEEWVSGQIALTRLHVDFIPDRAGRGMAMLDLRLGEITEVEVPGGPLGGVVELRTDAHLVRVRVAGAAGFGDQAAELVAAAQRY